MNQDFNIYNLSDAFAALNEIDESEIKSMYKSKSQQQRSRNRSVLMNEGSSVSINANKDELDSAKQLLAKRNDDDVELEVIDVNADTLAHLKSKKDYIGQIILQCNRCKSNNFIDPSELKSSGKFLNGDPQDAKSEIYNTDLQCGHCKQIGAGFQIVGQTAQFDPNASAETETNSSEEEKPADTEPAEKEPTIEKEEEPATEPSFENDFTPEVEEQSSDVELAELETPEENDSMEDKSPIKSYEDNDGMDTYTSEDDDLDMDRPKQGDEVDVDDDLAKDESYTDLNNFENYSSFSPLFGHSTKDESDSEKDEELDSEENTRTAPKLKLRLHKDQKIKESYATAAGVFDFGNAKNICECVIEPENIKTIELHDISNEEHPRLLYKGPYTEIDPGALAADCSRFDVANGHLICNIDSSDEIEGTCLADVLNKFSDKDTQKISLFDDAVNDEIFTGGKEDAINAFGDCRFVSLETPKVLRLYCICPEAIGCEEQGQDSNVEDLIKKTIEANRMSTYKLDNSKSDEFWIGESIRSGEDLDYIFEHYILGKSESLEQLYKSVTGYKTLIDEERQRLMELKGTAADHDSALRDARDYLNDTIKENASGIHAQESSRLKEDNGAADFADASDSSPEEIVKILQKRDQSDIQEASSSELQNQLEKFKTKLQDPPKNRSDLPNLKVSIQKKDDSDIDVSITSWDPNLVDKVTEYVQEMLGQCLLDASELKVETSQNYAQIILKGLKQAEPQEALHYNSFTNRKSLGEAIRKYQKEGIKFQVCKSMHEGYRYDLIRIPSDKDISSDKSYINEGSEDFNFQDLIKDAEICGLYTQADIQAFADQNNVDGKDLAIMLRGKADEIRRNKSHTMKPDGNKVMAAAKAQEIADNSRNDVVYGYTTAKDPDKFFEVGPKVYDGDDKAFRKQYGAATIYVAHPRTGKNDPVKEDLEGTDLPAEMQPVDNVTVADNIDGLIYEKASAVMGAYQNANKWLDSVKEAMYTKLNCPFFSSYVHKLAHTMPERFDKFGDILHTCNIEIPYPETKALDKSPFTIDEAFNVIELCLNDIKAALNEFIKCTDENYHGMSCSAEACLNDIEEEYPTIYRLKGKWEQCEGDMVDFDKYVCQYIDHKDSLVESLSTYNIYRSDGESGPSEHDADPIESFEAENDEEAKIKFQEIMNWNYDPRSHVVYTFRKAKENMPEESENNSSFYDIRYDLGHEIHTEHYANQEAADNRYDELMKAVEKPGSGLHGMNIEKVYPEKMLEGLPVPAIPRHPISLRSDDAERTDLLKELLRVLNTIMTQLQKSTKEMISLTKVAFWLFKRIGLIPKDTEPFPDISEVEENIPHLDQEDLQEFNQAVIVPMLQASGIPSLKDIPMHIISDTYDILTSADYDSDKIIKTTLWPGFEKNARIFQDEDPYPDLITDDYSNNSDQDEPEEESVIAELISNPDLWRKDEPEVQEEQVDFNEKCYERDINEFFATRYQNGMKLKVTEGRVNENGVITLFGKLSNKEERSLVTFTLTPKIEICNESYESCQKNINKRSYIVENNLSREKFEFVPEYNPDDEMNDWRDSQADEEEERQAVLDALARFQAENGTADYIPQKERNENLTEEYPWIGHPDDDEYYRDCEGTFTNVRFTGDYKDLNIDIELGGEKMELNIDCRVSGTADVSGSGRKGSESNQIIDFEVSRIDDFDISDVDEVTITKITADTPKGQSLLDAKKAEGDEAYERFIYGEDNQEDWNKRVREGVEAALHEKDLIGLDDFVEPNGEWEDA